METTMDLTRRLALLGLLSLGTQIKPGVVSAATGPNYPTKLIRIEIPVTPGGTADIVARVIAQHLQMKFGVSVIVETRPGGGGQVGVETVMRASPDGYTLLISPNGYVTIMGGFRSDFPDPRTALAPITKLINIPFAIAVNPTLPVKNLSEFIKYARERPDKLNYSVAAIGTHGHLVGEMFDLATGAEMEAVPYGGTASATMAVLSGDVQATISAVSSLLPLSESGKIRILAITDPARTEVAPDLPTVAEAGVPGFGISAWVALFAPAGTPPEIVTELNQEVARILTMPEVRKTILQIGVEPAPTSVKGMTDILDHDLVKWKELVKSAGIKFK
jgi:tripartite-type tricarboxylate transporter receptor subunit TctC